MPSAITEISEDVRTKRTNDVLFWRKLPPIFELQVPAKLTGTNREESYLFPLPMPPQQITTEYPFAVELTPTLGGLVVERNGVIATEIRLKGTMGQKPKPYRGSVFSGITPVERILSDKEVIQFGVPRTFSVSGHRFLIHLRDSVFGLYSDLCKDPETAEDVKLILHLPKTDEHYVVEPRSVVFPQDVGRNGLWDYEISLIGVGMAKPLPPPEEDSSWLSTLADAYKQTRAMIRLAKGIIQDLNKIRGEIERFVRKVTGAIDDVAAILEEATGFVEGTKKSITVTKDRIISSVDRLEAAMEAEGDQLTDEAAHQLMEVIDAMLGLALHADLFAPSPEVAIENAFRKGLGLFGVSRAGLAAAATQSPPETEAALRSTALLPTDQLRDDLLRAIPEAFRQYRSAFTVELGTEDSLERLAGLYLKDPRLWRHIAILNDLREPYLSEHGLPGTLRSGQLIQIPSTAAPARSEFNPAVLGADPADDPQTKQLGRDFLAEEDQYGREDWAVDVAGGGTDLRVAEGVACLSQDLRARVAPERDSDPLYRNLGVRPVIGFGAPDLEVDAWRLRVLEAVEQDPRVLRASDLSITDETSDTRSATISVYVKNAKKPLAVQASTIPRAGT